MVTSPDRAWPMKPVTTGVTPLASSGLSAFRIRASVPSRSGEALPKPASVLTTSVASIYLVLTPAASSAAVTSRAESRSPRATRKSLVRGVSSRRIDSPLASVSSSSTCASMKASSSLRTAPAGASAFAAAWCRSRSRAAAWYAAVTSPACALAAALSSRSVTPAIAETTTTRGPGRPCRIDTACRTAGGSASEAPPNLWTSRGAV